MRNLLILAFLFLPFAARAQTQPVPLLVSQISGITSSWPGECAAGVVDNRSAFLRTDDYFSIYVTGPGSWTAALNYSDTACTGPWVSFGSAAAITQATSPPIAFGIGYHPFIQVVITGSATASYSASKGYYLSTAAGSVTFPISFSQGGTGLSAAAANTTLISTSSAWTATAVPNCQDSGGNHLNFNTGTSLFSCGTSSSTNAFSAITSATNANHLTMGTGGIFDTSGTATINFGTAGATTPFMVGTVGGLPATCTAGQKYFATDATAGQNDYNCTATNTWTHETGTVTYPISLSNGGTGLSSAAANTTLISTGTAWTATAVPNCQDSGGNHLNFNTGTSLFSCGTSSSGGSTAFSAITSATNTNHLTMGTGGTLDSSGTATINFGAAGATTPFMVGTVAGKPATCAAGQKYFATDATAGQNDYNCTATNTWTQETSSGGLPTATDQNQFLRTKLNTGNTTTTEYATEPILNPADYNFPAISPAGSLSAGVAATATMPSFCPKGLVANDSNDVVGHRIHIGTTGTPEDVLITGGTCAGDGINGGTVIFTPANNHAAGYTITSATAGWNEAIRALPKDAGNVNAYTGLVRAVGGSTISSAISVPADGCAVRMDGGGFLVSSTSSTDDIIRTELPNFQAVNCGYRVDIENFILSATTSGAALRCSYCGGSGARNSFIANIQALGSPAICFWINGAGQGNGATFSNLQANGCTSEGIYNTISQVNMGSGLANVAQGGTFINPVIATASGANDAFLVTAESSACVSTCASGSVLSLIGPNLNGGQYGFRIQAIPNANLGEIYTTGGYFQGTSGAGFACRASAGSGNSVADVIVTGGGYMYSTSGYGLYIDSKCSTVNVSGISGIYTGNGTFPSVGFAGTHRAILANSTIGGGSTNTGTAVAFTIDANTSTATQDVLLTGNKIGFDPLYPSTYNVQAATGISIDANNHTQLAILGNEIVGGTHAMNYVCTASCAEISIRNNHRAARSGADVGWPVGPVQVQTNSTSSIGSTALATIPTPGLYRVHCYTGTGSSSGTSTVSVSIGWTDVSGAATAGCGTALTLGAGANQTGTILANVVSGNITYVTTFSSVSGGNYNLTFSLEPY